MILAVTLGVGAAVLSASRDSGIRNVAGRAYGALGASIPDYCLALVLVLIFYAALHWLPAPLGQSGPSAPSIRSRTGAYLLDAILAGNPTAIWDGITHLIMPVAALGIVFGSPIYRVARPAIEQIQASPYIEYAEMMGAKPRAVRAYVMQNALPPIVTLIGIIYGLLLGGAVLVETIFGWGGVGQYALQSVEAGDYFAIQGFVLAAALFSVIVYLIVDIAHAALDPRVRQSMW
jgi:peptide/nickel transport system permease protein